MPETNVAVPALVTLYALLFSRSHWKYAVFYWLPAIVFAVLHMRLIPKAGDGAYGMRLGWDALLTIGTYWQWSWLLQSATTLLGLPAPVSVVFAGLMAILVAALLCVARTRKAVLFGLGWWLLLLGPVLPLRDHISDYYLTAPLLGVGLAAAAAWNASQPLAAF